MVIVHNFLPNFPARLLQTVKAQLCDEHGHPVAMLENENIFQFVMSEFYIHEEEVSSVLIDSICVDSNVTPKELVCTYVTFKLYAFKGTCFSVFGEVFTLYL